MKRRVSGFARGCIGVFVLYCLCAVLLYGIAGEPFQWQPSRQEIFVPDSTHGAEPLYDNHVLEQTLRLNGSRIDRFGFKTCTYGRKNYGRLIAQLIDDASGEVLITQDFDMQQLPDNEFVFFRLEEPLRIASGENFTLRLTGRDAVFEQAASAVYHAEVSLPDSILRYDGTALPGSLCLEIRQSDRVPYIPAAVLLGLLLAGYLALLCRRKKAGQSGLVLNAAAAAQRYRFLMRQLVARDFKTKYKRSILGVLWSFLNPLLTMMVQYVVFSTLFRNDIQNFPAYLLVGVVFFNFFSEACGMGLLSIVDNAPLITKVYIPKYIFPAARVLSSFVNFALALLPLFAVLLFTGQRVTKAFFLLPFSLACMLVFCLGMSMLLSALMVFFRDVQFLWNVVNMLWMYMTPVFYPETIIPELFLPFYKLNPLYQFITFTRVILLEGVSPAPGAYLACVLAAAVPLAAGLALFRRTQDRFVLNI